MHHNLEYPLTIHNLFVQYLPEPELKQLCDMVCDLLLEESNVQPGSFIWHDFALLYLLILKITPISVQYLPR